MSKRLNFEKIKNCQICNGKLEFVLSLGNQPLCDDLIKINSNKKNKLYPINILYCTKCITAYNEILVKPENLFPKTYHYRSRLTEDVLNGMSDLVFDLKKDYGPLGGKKILDIGCNDGSLLNFFKKEKSITIGVEPTNSAKESKNHEIYNNFFTKKIAKNIKKKYKKIDFIIFTNVFAHINDLQNLLCSLRKIISKNTKIIIENHYLGSILKKKQFDTFYHEHPRTYSLTSFVKISKQLNMNIEKFSFPIRYGGNIRVVLGNGNANNRRLHSVLKEEKKFYVSLLKINNFVIGWKKNTMNKIKEFKKFGFTLVGKAFPGRASILINLLGINKSHIKKIYEKTGSPKIGFYAPNTNIPIISDTNITNLKNNVIIVNFAWHIKKEIKKYLTKLKIKNKIYNIL